MPDIRSLASLLVLPLFVLPLTLAPLGCAAPGHGKPGDADEADTAGSDTDSTDTDSTDTDSGDTDPADTDPGDTDSTDTDSEDSGSGPDDPGTPDPGDPASVGSCDAWDAPVAVATVSDDALSELSDVVPSRANPGILWGHNDSGGDPVLYAIAAATGDLVGTLTVEGVSNHDWEDLAVAPCAGGGGDCVYVGDVGDNGLSRDDVAVLAVPEPAVPEPHVEGAFTESAAPTVYRYDWPDGRNNVEGLGIGPDGLPVLVTKRVDATADVYRFPALDASRTVTVTLVARVDTGDPDNEHAAEATGADVSPDGTRLLVRTYDHLLEYPLVDGVPGTAVSLPAPDEPQGEAAAYDPVSGGIWLTSEGSRQPLWFVACLAPRP